MPCLFKYLSGTWLPLHDPISQYNNNSGEFIGKLKESLESNLVVVHAVHFGFLGGEARLLLWRALFCFSVKFLVSHKSISFLLSLLIAVYKRINFQAKFLQMHTWKPLRFEMENLKGRTAFVSGWFKSILCNGSLPCCVFTKTNNSSLFIFSDY